MKVDSKWTTASIAMAVAMLTSESAFGQTNEPIVELPSAIDMDISAWRVDRADVASFTNTDWEGRDDVIRISITPPSSPTSFYNWQGYQQALTAPAGSASLSGDMWIGSDWATGTASDYVRTGIWGSVLPEGSTSYIDAQAVFPIISFTNEDGEARLQVWDTTANPTSGWNDLDASQSALNLDDWNSFEMRVLPEGDRIDYVVNGVTIYTWTMPRGEVAGNISDEFWAVYLNGRNNGVTSFDTYWSDLTEAHLVLDGGILTAAPDGFNILADAAGSVSIADGVTVGGTIHADSGSAVTVAFGDGSGVATTVAGEAAVVSDEGGSVRLNGGIISTSGANAHGLHAVGAGSEITTEGTIIAVTGAGSYGAYAQDGGIIALSGGSVSSNRAALVAGGSTVTATTVALSTTVAADNANETGVVTTLDGGEATLSGGTVTLGGGRMAGLLALSEGTITAENVSISASGDRARGIYANADNDGGGSVTISGSSIETNGLLAHGLFGKRQSGTTADTMTSIRANDIEISVNGTNANGVYADVGSSITVNGATVTTGGDGGVGLHAQGFDDGIAGEGSVAAIDVDVATSGANAFGGYAELGGELTINGGSITTSGSNAYGLTAAGTVDHHSRIEATDLEILVMNDEAVGIGIAGSGTIEFTGGSITSAGDAIGVRTLAGGTATFSIAGSTLSSDSVTILDVDRNSGDGTGIVLLTLSDGTTAAGDIRDMSAKTTGYTDVTLDNATFAGTVDGVRILTLSDGATWNVTGAGSIDTLTLGAGGGAIDVAAGSNFELSGTLTGGGDLTKDGSGTLVLSGDGRAYAGTAMIDDGVVLLTGSLAGDVVVSEDAAFQIGNGDETGDLTGSTVNSGTLIFARSDDYDYRGALAGDGDLIKLGDGTLLLSGAYAYTGSTVVAGGLIRLASILDPETDLVLDGGTFDLGGQTQQVSGLSGQGGTLALGDTGAIIVNQSGDTIYAGTITGTGEFTKAGEGSLNLTGNSSFSGTANVNGGSLAVNGVFPANVIVNSGGTLHGNGTVGGVTAAEGGTVAPGRSIGTLYVTGDVTFDAGSIYAVEVDADGNSDQIIASGAATLNGGTVSVTAAEGDYDWTVDYTILTAEGGVTGTFADTSVDLLFLDAYLIYGANEVVLELVRNDLSFADAAVTANQLSVATALDAGDPTSDVYQAVAAQADADSARLAFDALSGEAWASMGTVLIDQSRRTGELVLGRLQQADGNVRIPVADSASTETDGRNTAFWGQFTGSWNRIDSDGNAGSLDQDSHGFITGIDTVLGAWRFGAAFGYGEADSAIDIRESEAEASTASLAIYAGGGWGGVRLHMGASYAWHDVDGQRAVSFTGFSDEVSGGYDGHSASLFAELSHTVAIESSSRIEPFAGINYVHLKTDAFDEVGGDAALAVDAAERDVSFTTLGLRARTDIAVSETVIFAPHLSLAWQHGFGDLAAYTSNSLSTGETFTVTGLPMARNALALRAGFEATLLPGGRLGFSYVGNIASRWSDHGLRAGFSYSF